MKNIPRMVKTGKTCGPGTITRFIGKLKSVVATTHIRRAYLKELAGIDDSSSEGNSKDGSVDWESI